LGRTIRSESTNHWPISTASCKPRARAPFQVSSRQQFGPTKFNKNNKPKLARFYATPAPQSANFWPLFDRPNLRSAASLRIGSICGPARPLARLFGSLFYCKPTFAGPIPPPRTQCGPRARTQHSLARTRVPRARRTCADLRAQPPTRPAPAVRRGRVRGSN